MISGVIRKNRILNFATIFYLEKRRGHTTKKILDRFRLINKVIATVDQTAKSYQSTLDANFSDFEDALQYFAAVENQSNFFITGNKKDYKNSVIPVLSAKEYFFKKIMNYE